MWQTIALYGTLGVVAVGVVYIAFRMIRREARKTGVDSEARRELERILEMDEKSHRLDGRPVPVSIDEQRRRLRDLQARIARYRGRAVSGDD